MKKTHVAVVVSEDVDSAKSPPGDKGLMLKLDTEVMDEETVTELCKFGARAVCKEGLEEELELEGSSDEVTFQVIARHLRGCGMRTERGQGIISSGQLAPISNVLLLPAESPGRYAAIRTAVQCNVRRQRSPRNEGPERIRHWSETASESVDLRLREI